MSKPTRAAYRVTFMVPQVVRLDVRRTVEDLDTGCARVLTPEEQATNQAIDYIKTVAGLPFADDMLHGLIVSVKQVEVPE